MTQKNVYIRSRGHWNHNLVILKEATKSHQQLLNIQNVLEICPFQIWLTGQTGSKLKLCNHKETKNTLCKYEVLKTGGTPNLI